MTDLQHTAAELDLLETGLTPIADVPDWCNTFLHELLTNENHFGVIKYAARTVGKSWWGVDYWRHKVPTFGAELARVYELVNNAIDDEIEHRIIELSLGGVTETTIERISTPTEILDDADEEERAVLGASNEYRYIKKTKQYHDLRSLQWLLERRRRQRYGRDQEQGFGDGPNVTFKFVLGDEKLPTAPAPAQADIEGEVTSETDEPLAEIDAAPRGNDDLRL